MNQKQIEEKVKSMACNLINEKGYIAPVELFIGMNILSRTDYEDWRMGRILYLEKVCKVSLGKMSSIMKELRIYAIKNNLKGSFTAYKKWGKGNKVDLRFSKSGDANIEKFYSTHFVSSEHIFKAKNDNDDITKHITKTKAHNR